MGSNGMTPERPIFDERTFFENTGRLFPPTILSQSCSCSTGPNIEGPNRDCPQHGEMSGEDEYGKPLDFEDGLPVYRITLKSSQIKPPAGSVTRFEMALDAADLDLLKRLSAASHMADRFSSARTRICIHQRIHEGDIKDNQNFKAI